MDYRKQTELQFVDNENENDNDNKNDRDMAENVNLTEAMREKVVDNGWKEVFAFGRKRPVWTPEALRAAFVEYLGFADGSPLTKDIKMSSKVSGEDGSEDSQDTERRMVRPYNMKSMCARLGIADWEKFKARYCEGASDEAQEFAELCARIENFIHGNLQEGATAGIYNAKMVMGLTDVAEHVKQEVSGFDGMSDEELKAERDRLWELTKGDASGE